MDEKDFFEDEYYHAYHLNGEPLVCEKHREGMFNSGRRAFCPNYGL